MDPNDADFQLGEANTKNYIIIDKQFRVGFSAQFHPISCKDHKETLGMLCNTGGPRLGTIHFRRRQIFTSF